MNIGTGWKKNEGNDQKFEIHVRTVLSSTTGRLSVTSGIIQFYLVELPSLHSTKEENGAAKASQTSFANVR